jgi:HD-GYP domain-containing protein (c-di-GMP phosphodiesterase class II)
MTATAPTAPPQVAGYVPVSIIALRVMGDVDYDLYLADDEEQGPLLFRSRTYDSTSEDFAAVEARGIQSLYVTTDDHAAYNRQLKEHLEEILQDDNIEHEQRCGMLQTAVAAEIEKAFNLVKVDNAVEQSQQVGGQIAALLSGSDTLPSDPFGVVRHDYYTFTHLTNVASYCVLLAEKLGISDEEDLEAIAIGGLLHDVGKRLIPKQILNKPSRLTQEEFKVVQTHPQLGYEELHDREDLSLGQLMMVYQHHEKVDGSGYPVGITGDEMHLWARICAVVDVFDAMTAKRPYRDAMDVGVVLDRMLEGAGTHFDKEIMQCWAAAMRNN